MQIRGCDWRYDGVDFGLSVSSRPSQVVRILGGEWAGGRTF